MLIPGKKMREHFTMSIFIFEPFFIRYKCTKFQYYSKHETTFRKEELPSWIGSA